ncbi:hypothetical protein K435DRAFT_795464 [Dendrothele bispora CBS 962.96]|uniref:Uncharacterized protein n=1 Tax=Dendrothele bispora (strain CBS 962.96) TaxID=1314807 RepID=A0A4S8M8L6_DENBC|nr:hypothetical protein K435DRAFT_795464 [Dendrothele bispora CBS 962.96]
MAQIKKSVPQSPLDSSEPTTNVQTTDTPVATPTATEPKKRNQKVAPAKGNNTEETTKPLIEARLKPKPKPKAKVQNNKMSALLNPEPLVQTEDNAVAPAKRHQRTKAEMAAVRAEMEAEKAARAQQKQKAHKTTLQRQQNQALLEHLAETAQQQKQANAILYLSDVVKEVSFQPPTTQHHSDTSKYFNFELVDHSTQGRTVLVISSPRKSMINIVVRGDKVGWKIGWGNLVSFSVLPRWVPTSVTPGKLLVLGVIYVICLLEGKVLDLVDGVVFNIGKDERARLWGCGVGFNGASVLYWLLVECGPAAMLVSSFSAAATSLFQGQIQNGYGKAGIAKVPFNFRREDKLIQLMLAVCVMDFVTHDYTVSLFPILDLVSHIFLVNGINDDDAPSALVKYRRRGWEMQRVPTYTDFLFSESKLGQSIRWPGDEFCYIRPLTAYGSSHSVDEVHETLAANSWSVSIASDMRSSICFDLGEVEGWKSCCVARQLMESGLIIKTSQMLAIDYQNGLVMTLRSHRVFLKRSRTWMLRIFQMSSCWIVYERKYVTLFNLLLPSIKCKVSVTPKRALKISLGWGRAMSLAKRGELMEWVKNPMITTLVASHISVTLDGLIVFLKKFIGGVKFSQQFSVPNTDFDMESTNCPDRAGGNLNRNVLFAGVIGPVCLILKDCRQFLKDSSVIKIGGVEIVNKDGSQPIP